MDVIENFGLFLVRALGFLAHRLGELASPLPWPLVMAVAALPLLYGASFVIWVLRGMVWPVRCKYPETTKRKDGDSACRVSVVGEWHYCRHHRRMGINSRGKAVDPSLPRWQTIQDGQRVDRADVRFLSSNVSWLFYRGFARKPGQVWEALPSVVSGIRDSFAAAVTRIVGRPVELERAPAAASAGPTTDEREKYTAFDARAERADQALYVLKWLLPAAFVMVAASAFVRGSWTVPLQYAALLLLWIAVEVFRNGLFRASGDKDWRAQVFLGTLKGFGTLTAVAIASMLLGEYVLPFIERLSAGVA